MSGARPPRRRGHDGRVADVRFVEVEFAAPAATRMIVELECGVRLLLADRAAIPLAAELLALLARLSQLATVFDYF